MVRSHSILVALALAFPAAAYGIEISQAIPNGDMEFTNADDLTAGSWNNVVDLAERLQAEHKYAQAKAVLLVALLTII